MKLLNDDMAKKVAHYENNPDTPIQELKLFVEELITVQIRTITYCLLKTLALSSWKIPKEYLWHLFMIEENEINPVSDYEDEVFKSFCEKVNEKIVNSEHIFYDDLFFTPIKIIGGYLYFGDEGRINQFLASYNSYLRLYIPLNKKYRIKNLKEILNISDNKKINDITYILGYTYPISSFSGKRLYIFLKEKALSPLFNNNAQGNNLNDTICIRQTMVLKGMIDYQNSTSKAINDYHIYKEGDNSIRESDNQEQLSRMIKHTIDFYKAISNGISNDSIDTYFGIDGCILAYMKYIENRDTIFHLTDTDFLNYIRNQIYYKIYGTLIHERVHGGAQLSNMDDKHTISYHTIRKDILFYLQEKKVKLSVENVFKLYINGYNPENKWNKAFAVNLGCGYSDKISIEYENIIEELKKDKLIIEDKNGYLVKSKFLEGK